MILSKDDKEIKWYWADGKMHTLSVEVEGEKISLKELYETCKKTTKDMEEKCKDISYLGVTLTGTEEAAIGFLMGWLVRSIKANNKWQIIHVAEDVPEEDIREHLACMFEEGARLIRENTDGSKPKAMSPLVGGTDGTEMFS